MVDLDHRRAEPAHSRTRPGLYPEWSPDGEWLAFQRPSNYEPGWHGIWIVPVAGGSASEVTASGRRRRSNRRGRRTRSQIVCAKATETGAQGQPHRPTESVRSEDLWVVSIDDGTRYQLTSNGSVDYAPAWGLDGRIYFTSTRSGSSRIVSVQPMTGRPLKLEIGGQ